MSDIEILYKNKDFVVCIKPSGVLSQVSESNGKNMQDFFKEKIYCIHRLDREVSGVMVYAFNSAAASKLSKQIQDGDFKKEYVAIIHGEPSEKEGFLNDILFKDSKKNKSYVVKRERKGAKKAKLYYKTIHSEDNLSLIFIRLYTGRTHQIRVQFASRKMPLYADKKYGGKDDGKIALFSKKISFKDFNTGEILEFSHDMPHNGIWEKFTSF